MLIDWRTTRLRPSHHSSNGVREALGNDMDSWRDHRIGLMDTLK